MKILIDACLPRRLKAELPGHSVFTVPEMGWAGKKNGELLALMSGVFDVFMTADQNLQYQQQIAQHTIAFIVLVAASNKLESLTLLMPELLGIFPTIQPGTVTEIHPPHVTES